MGEYPLLRSLRKSRSQRFLSSYQSLIRAVPDMIDTKTQEIKAADKETYSDMRDVGDGLPDSSPRFILLSYPLTLVSRESCDPPCNLSPAIVLYAPPFNRHNLPRGLAAQRTRKAVERFSGEVAAELFSIPSLAIRTP